MIERNPSALEGGVYDVIVVGGGVYGACLTLECVARGLRPLLLEKSDFGGGASANTLRVVHGGLRYLQSLDLRRFRRSVEQRRWWLKTFPSLVHPMPCLMPLYGQGLKRPSVLRIALLLNDLLSSDRNRGVPDNRKIRRGRMVDALETRELFSGCDPEGLKGAALWFDASMVSPQRLIMELLRWACAGGASASNYVSAQKLLIDRGAVAGVLAVDQVSDQEHVFEGQIVINTAGPEFADAWSVGASNPDLSRSLAFNVLLRSSFPSSVAVAGTGPTSGERTYFMRPRGGATLAGTYHAPWRPSQGKDPETSARSMVPEFLDELRRAFPGLVPAMDDVVRLFWGLVPADGPGSAEPSKRPTVVSHRSHGGPVGLYSVLGVKFTTAPALASKAVDLAIESWSKPLQASNLEAFRPTARPLPEAIGSDPSEPELHRWLASERIMLQDMVRDEAVVWADDLVLRRLDLAMCPFDLQPTVSRICELVPDLAIRPQGASHA